MLWERTRPYLMVAPAIILFLVFYIYPIYDMIHLSFTSWNMLNPVKEYVGFENYVDLLNEPDFIQVISNTFVYTFLTVFLSLAFGLMLAMWLNRKSFFHGFAQAAVFSPHIISLVSVSLLWLWLMDPQFGLLNWVLDLLNLPKSAWLTRPESALFSLAIVQIWKHVGYNALVFIAGLQSIPRDVYEAADLDRTPKWRKFFKITFPLLSPTLFFLLVINTIDSFKVFDTVSIMTQGGPVNSTNMLVFFVYEYAFDFFKIGYASAAGVVLLILTAILTFVHFGLLSRRVHYK
jgi:sn-glycerol 3-phosphate transport system permease protein